MLKASDRQAVWAPFAANLAIELWKTKQDQFEVRVLYNGVPLDHTGRDAPPCDGKLATGCAFDDFSSYIQGNAIKFMN